MFVSHSSLLLRSMLIRRTCLHDYCVVTLSDAFVILLFHLVKDEFIRHGVLCNSTAVGGDSFEIFCLFHNSCTGKIGVIGSKLQLYLRDYTNSNYCNELHISTVTKQNSTVIY